MSSRIQLVVDISMVAFTPFGITLIVEGQTPATLTFPLCDGWVGSSSALRLLRQCLHCGKYDGPLSKTGVDQFVDKMLCGIGRNSAKLIEPFPLFFFWRVRLLDPRCQHQPDLIVMKLDRHHPQDGRQAAVVGQEIEAVRGDDCHPAPVFEISRRHQSDELVLSEVLQIGLEPFFSAWKIAFRVPAFDSRQAHRLWIEFGKRLKYDALKVSVQLHVVRSLFKKTGGAHV
ncbi:hypothetical protein [uncultured Castellaniella sp.]|uniref:hypothetical protein n=1 Tax=uncultured Castellaniella sp. TaxID=647907 RepID=UPI0026212540|nr:hypothetical protein [uncultured Castellaniella sp.]